MSDRLDGKVVIVTGGTRGMGEAIVRGIVRHGGAVVFGGRDEAAGAAIAQTLGDAALYVRQDVTSRDDWVRIVGAAQARFGRVTGLVNNAGEAHSATLRNITDADFARQVAVNQTSVMLGMQQVVEPMRDHGSGSIVNISSPAGVRSHPGLVAYAGAKAAVVGMSLAAAGELAHRAIRVNVIVPGFFATRLLDESSGGKGRAIGAERSPMRRVAEPEEIVGPVVFLLSDEASYVTGATLAVDGGLTA